MARKKKAKLKPKGGLQDRPNLVVIDDFGVHPRPRPAKVGDKVRVVGPPSGDQADSGPRTAIREVVEVTPYGGSIGYTVTPVGAHHPPSSLEHEDGTPVAAPEAKEEDAPPQGVPISPVLLSQAQAQAHRGLLPNPFATDPGVWMGIDQAESPLDRLQKEIEKRGLEDWAHEHLEWIDLLDSSDWGLLYSARKVVQRALGGIRSVDEDAFRFVTVRGNIGQLHWLWVPPFCKTAEQAVAWTFGMLLGEYAPISES